MRGPVASSDHFPTTTTGLPTADSPRSFEFADGAQFELRISPVTKRLGDTLVRMLAYNGSVPGPTLRVRQGTELLVNVVNDGDLEATVHWHGLRLDNRYDGTMATPVLIRKLQQTPTTNAMVRTTTAATMFQAGTKDTD